MTIWADTYLYFVVEFVDFSLDQQFFQFHSDTACGDFFFTFSLVISFFFFTDGWFNRENWLPWTLFRSICSTFCCNFKIISLSELNINISELSPRILLEQQFPKTKNYAHVSKKWASGVQGRGYRSVRPKFIPCDENLEPIAIEAEAAALYNFYGSWHLYICRSVFGHSAFFVASLVFIKGTSCCVIKRKFNFRSCYGKVR